MYSFTHLLADKKTLNCWKMCVFNNSMLFLKNTVIYILILYYAFISFYKKI